MAIMSLPFIWVYLMPTWQTTFRFIYYLYVLWIIGLLLFYHFCILHHYHLPDLAICVSEWVRDWVPTQAQIQIQTSIVAMKWSSNFSKYSLSSGWGSLILSALLSHFDSLHSLRENKFILTAHRTITDAIVNYFLAGNSMKLKKELI